MKAWRVFGLVGYVLLRLVDGCGEWNVPEMSSVKSDEAASLPLPGDLTLIKSAFDKGAVCLDGSLPGYHLHRGYGSGKNSWFVFLEGGAWCNDIGSCVERSKTKLGSSEYMEKQINFIEILSDKPEENPDLFNWNRVVIRYCDGGSFSGEGYDKLWQSLSTVIADPLGHWIQCKKNYKTCNPEQLQFLQGFRRQMLENVSDFSTQSKNGLFINSCFSHCQSCGGMDTWFSDNSPMISNKKIAESFSDWYFDRSEVKLVGCPYPCDKTCHHITLEDEFIKCS